MFGGQGQDNNQTQDQIPDSTVNGVLNDQPAQDQFAGQDPAATQPQDQFAPQVQDAAAEPAPAAEEDQSQWQHPGTPISDVTGGHSIPPHLQPVQPPVDPITPTDYTQTAAVHHDDGNAGLSDDLIDLKQQALGKLSPLVGQLDQAADEKFRTLMMLIQASDDQSLLKQAYEAAQGIEDEKTRAQALLDVVNEINYFTQPHQD